jgi:hypothetical protein
MLGTESVYSVQPVKPFLMGCYACTAVAPVRRSQGAPYAHQRPFPKQVLLQMSPVVARVPDMYPVSHCRSRFYSFETTLAVRSTTTCVLAVDSQAALGTPPVSGWAICAKPLETDKIAHCALFITLIFRPFQEMADMLGSAASIHVGAL